VLIATFAIDNTMAEDADADTDTDTEERRPDQTRPDQKYILYTDIPSSPAIHTLSRPKHAHHNSPQLLIHTKTARSSCNRLKHASPCKAEHSHEPHLPQFQAILSAITSKALSQHYSKPAPMTTTAAATRHAKPQLPRTSPSVVSTLDLSIYDQVPPLPPFSPHSHHCQSSTSSPPFSSLQVELHPSPLKAITAVPLHFAPPPNHSCMIIVSPPCIPYSSAHCPAWLAIT
jgi:hypothetical protein